MSPPTINLPGDPVPVSGTYRVVDVYGAHQGRQTTEEAGSTFSPIRIATNEYGFVLHEAAEEQ